MVPGLPRKNWYYTFDHDGPCPHRQSPGYPRSSNQNELVGNAAKLCEAFSLEFGALDIVVDQDSCPYVIDVNPTPGWGLEKQGEILDFLRDGF